tara:strand:- start:92 stop:547 length:456 start_codon:yes stop_codon:yes gene_type:complete
MGEKQVQGWAKRRHKEMKGAVEHRELLASRRAQERDWQKSRERTRQRRISEIVLAWATVYEQRGTGVSPSLMEMAAQIRMSYGTAYNCVVNAVSDGYMTGLGEGGRTITLTDLGWDRLSRVREDIAGQGLDIASEKCQINGITNSRGGEDD